jgi:ABC-type transport system substrate-binding protein
MSGGGLRFDRLGQGRMMGALRLLAAAGSLLVASLAAAAALAQKAWRHFANARFRQPASMSLPSANYTGYCNPDTDLLIDRQSMEADPEKRRKLVWEIEGKLAEDASRPVLLYSRFATCMQARLKGLTTMTNSRFNGWRMEDVWLEN